MDKQQVNICKTPKINTNKYYIQCVYIYIYIYTHTLYIYIYIHISLSLTVFFLTTCVVGEKKTAHPFRRQISLGKADAVSLHAEVGHCSGLLHCLDPCCQ